MLVILNHFWIADLVLSGAGANPWSVPRKYRLPIYFINCAFKYIYFRGKSGPYDFPCQQNRSITTTSVFFNARWSPLSKFCYKKVPIGHTPGTPILTGSQQNLSFLACSIHFQKNKNKNGRQ